MENFLKRKKRRNSLIFLSLSVVLILVVLLLPGGTKFVHNNKFVAEVGQKKVFTKKITLLFVGDIMLSRAVGAMMEKSGNWKYPFLEIAEFLKSADLTFGNLEGPISSRGTNIGSIYSFRANPKVVEGLVYAGFDVLSLANNHIWDYGRVAFMDTIQTLESVGISPVGGGLNYKKAHEPAIKIIGDTKLAYLAYTSLVPPISGSKEATPATSFLELETAVTDVLAAKALADIVVVSLHWGDEYNIVPDDYQKTIAQALVDAGADLIIGHHPHVVQKIEKYGSGIIAYSLGNFVFDQNFSEETMKGIILKVLIKDKKIERSESIEVRINKDFQPLLIGR